MQQQRRHTPNVGDSAAATFSSQSRRSFSKGSRPQRGMSFRQGRKEPGPGFRRQRVPYNSVATGCAGRQLLPSILFAQSRRRKRRSPSTTTTTSIRANLLQFRVRRYKYSWKMELLAGWTILRAMCAATCRLDCQGSHADSDTQLPPRKPRLFSTTSSISLRPCTSRFQPNCSRLAPSIPVLFRSRLSSCFRH